MMKSHGKRGTVTSMPQNISEQEFEYAMIPIVERR